MFQLIVPPSDFTIIYIDEEITLWLKGQEIFRGTGDTAADYVDLLVYGTL
jgi:hypothetical protein